MALQLVETLVQYKMVYVYDTEETIDAVLNDIEHGEPVEFIQEFLGEKVFAIHKTNHREVNEIFRKENPQVKNNYLYKRTINEI